MTKGLLNQKILEYDKCSEWLILIDYDKLPPPLTKEKKLLSFALHRRRRTGNNNSFLPSVQGSIAAFFLLSMAQPLRRWLVFTPLAQKLRTISGDTGLEFILWYEILLYCTVIIKIKC